MIDYDPMRLQLINDRRDILGTQESLGRDTSVLAADGHGEARRQLLNEGDTLSVERSIVAQLSRGAQRTLADIEAALERLDAGTYGICTSCQGTIMFERLEARPRAATCVPCTT